MDTETNKKNIEDFKKSSMKQIMSTKFWRNFRNSDKTSGHCMH